MKCYVIFNENPIFTHMLLEPTTLYILCEFFSNFTLVEHGNTDKAIKTIVLIALSEIWGHTHLIFPSPNGDVSFDYLGVCNVKYFATRSPFAGVSMMTACLNTLYLSQRQPSLRGFGTSMKHGWLLAEPCISSGVHMYVFVGDSGLCNAKYCSTNNPVHPHQFVVAQSLI